MIDFPGCSLRKVDPPPVPDQGTLIEKPAHSQGMRSPLRRMRRVLATSLAAGFICPNGERRGEDQSEAIPGQGVLEVLAAQTHHQLSRLWQTACRHRGFLLDVERRGRRNALGIGDCQRIAREPEVMRRIVGRREPATGVRPAQRSDDFERAEDLAIRPRRRSSARLWHEAAIDDGVGAAGEPGRREDPVAVIGHVGPEG